MRSVVKALLRPGDGTLFGRAMSAGFWAVALRFVLRGALIVRTVILARILTPEDFGLIAIATISIALLERFTQSGIDAALVQRSGDVKGYLNTAWTFQILRGLFMATILAVSAPWIAQFFGAQEAEQIIQVLSLAVAIRGFVNIGVVMFIKDLRFEKYFVLEVSGRGTDIVVSIVAAFMIRNVWALVIGVIAGAIGRLIASYVISKYRPRLRWAWGQVRQLFGFGKWVMASEILNFAASNIDDILVGRMLGPASLGLYRMAYNFSQAVASEIGAVTNQVAFPTYSMLQDATDRLRSAYMGSVHFVAFLSFPFAVGTILVAPDLVYGILGEQWSAIIVPLRLLSIAGLIRAISMSISPLFRSQGQPNVPPRFSLAKLVVLAILLYPAIDHAGIVGAAAAVTVSGGAAGISALVLALHTVEANVSDVIQAIGFPALNTLAMAIVVAAARLLFFESSTALSFFALAAIGCLAYAGMVMLSTRFLNYAAPSDLWDRVRKAAA